MGSSHEHLSNQVLRTNALIMNVVVAVLVIFGISSFLKYRRGLKVVGSVPGLRVPFYPTDFPGVVLPTTWWNPGYLFLWKWRFSNYAQFGVDTFSVVPFVVGKPSFYTANIDVLRQVVGGGHKTSFAKGEHQSDIMKVWGTNLLAADKEIWRKHRRVVGPAFSPNLHQDVWTQTLQIYQEAIVAENWMSRTEIQIPCIQAITFKLALLVIAQCGFGFDFTWSDPPRNSSGRMSVQQALSTVTNDHLLMGFAPKWLLRLPFQELREAHEQIDSFMKAQVRQRKKQVIHKDAEITGHDIFTMLVKANEDEDAKLKLDDSELVGNVFVMLFAGHETTAHALAATLGLLATHQELQKEIHEQIFSVCGHDGEPSFDDHTKLNKVQAAFYEAARLFPPAHILQPREAWEDTVLHIPNPKDQDGVLSLPIPKGTFVTVDMITTLGISKIRLNSSPLDAFSVGPRSCVGRKFAVLEALAFLTSLLRDFSVHPLLADGETLEAWKVNVLDANIGVTLGVKDMPLRLVRRK
ncbi:cytochrome P450 [Crepidotus variabilis]|uniref:Cytochrome P450 n=1 Tax=Crepidotus variabilis TaxID=179855 RepID=A0A9P6JRL2_9AGAR|nr:cytochrome P450 [Crepidotus variabilis]